MSDSDVRLLFTELRALTAKVDNLTDAFNHAAHGEGFHRCARHSERLKVVETSVELSHARISGVKKWMVSALIAMATMLVNYAWSVIQSAAKH